jgi:uncharacterized protein DUF6438
MKNKYSLKLVLIIAFFAIQCKNTSQHSSIQSDSHLFSLKTSECMGTCPVYTFTVFPDGTCTYQGFANVDKLGTFNGTISTEQLNQFKSVISTSDFFNIIIDNNSLVKDLPSTYLFYNDGNKQKTITYYNANNKYIETLINKANGLIENIKWTKN